MDNRIIQLMALLSKISVSGNDVERMVVALHLLRQLQSDLNKLKQTPNPPKEGALTK